MTHNSCISKCISRSI